MAVGIIVLVAVEVVVLLYVKMTAQLDAQADVKQHALMVADIIVRVIHSKLVADVLLKAP